jgi:hypothetical protein
MTSFRQIEANRRNAFRSTGPKTEEGKRRTRQNALRHGLTSETVIVAVEDIEDYQAFEASVIADYDARTAVERELVLRLASLLWRIRRATTIETDLLQSQAEILNENRSAVAGKATQLPGGIAHRVIRSAMHQDVGENEDSDHEFAEERVVTQSISISDWSDINPRDLTTCFLRLANLDNGVFERLGRFEAALWRQIVQILLVMRTARYR